MYLKQILSKQRLTWFISELTHKSLFYISRHTQFPCKASLCEALVASATFSCLSRLWPVDDIYQRFVMKPICRTQSVVEPRFSFRQNDFSREMGRFRWDSLLTISATFSDHPHHRMKIAALIVWQFYEENSAIETTIMDKKCWDTFAHLGHFPIHTGPTPPLTSQTTLDVCIQHFFRVSTLCRVGGGRTTRKFRKRRTVSWGNRKVTEKFECCITVPRTLNHDCSCPH